MRFGSLTTADEVLAGVELTGKRALVTGVSSGLGTETARALVAKGVDVIGTVRDRSGGSASATSYEVADDLATGTFELIDLDLASLASVRRLADRLAAENLPLDLLVANAGVMACPPLRTTDGFELQLGTNHLGHFVLANRLAPLMSRGARLVMLSSAAHRFADVDLDDPNFERSAYDPWVAYGRSKTANILFALEFDRRHRNRGVRAVAVHPGMIQTGIGRHLTPELLEALASRARTQEAGEAVSPQFKTIAQGAATTLWAGVVAEPDRIGGAYCEDCEVARIAREPAGAGVQAYACDPARAQALWERSEKWAGERF